MRPYNTQIITNVTLNAAVASSALSLDQIYGYAIQAVITGTPTGTLKVQGSCDQSGVLASPGNATNVPTNWTDITTQAVSAAGSWLFDKPNTMYNWVRLTYTDGSSGASTAVLNARINAKGV